MVNPYQTPYTQALFAAAMIQYLCFAACYILHSKNDELMSLYLGRSPSARIDAEDENEFQNEQNAVSDEEHEDDPDTFKFKFDKNDPYAPYRFEGGTSETSSVLQTHSILRSPNKNLHGALPKKSVRFEIENVDESVKSEENEIENELEDIDEQ